MFIDKIKSGSSGLLLYGITPPKAETTPERISEIAERTMARLTSLDIDALVVYDVQDESARTDEERPFPFLQALDPLHFSLNYLGSLQLPKIIYRPAGKFSPEELEQWLDTLHSKQFYPVFVGVPAPDFPVKTTLPEAYQLWSKHEDSSVLGAVTIPERHAVLNDEHLRMLDKMSCGVSYFVSQCVFNVGYAKQVIDAVANACEERKATLPTIIFTLTACGSAKTLQFMKWLGIHIPETLQTELLNSENMLDHSVQVCLNIAKELTDYCISRNIPFGFNIESVAIRKDEIEASVKMTETIGQLLAGKGLRNLKDIKETSV